ncbi:MAG TPA: aminotransferase, partial [Eubacteriaceae bacterium]|nr:aminotransferase [Eubacteriaceae bacterium]
DLLPLWVADMDFKTSSYIQEALENQARHGIFGYSEVQGTYFEAVRRWMKDHYDWDVNEDWLLKTPGIVFALAMAVKSLTDPGDKVLIQLPVYHPFREVIEDNGREVVSNTLYLGEDNRYHIDFEDFEKIIQRDNIKLFFLCNPHNPVGRVWRREELEKLGNVCYKHNVTVVSDEIHADFIFQGKHHVFAGLKKEFEEIAITCTSPSKTFNLAGLQISNVFIANPKIKNAFNRQMRAAGYSQLNVMGLVACEAAYEYGETWYREMYDYVRKNIRYTKSYIEENIPNVSMVNHEGTYLVWIDFRKLGLSANELDKLIVKKAKLWLNGGAIFGESGTGFQRINVGCPRVILEEALERIKKAVETLNRG